MRETRLGLTQWFNTDSGFEFNTLFNTFAIVVAHQFRGRSLPELRHHDLHNERAVIIASVLVSVQVRYTCQQGGLGDGRVWRLV